MIKQSIQEENITVINIYTPQIGEPTKIKQILAEIKGETDRNKIIIGDINTLSCQCTEIFQTENQ